MARHYSAGQILTSEMALTEFLNGFSDHGPRRQAAAEAVVSLRERSDVVIFAQSSDLFEKALKKYRHAGDKSWGLTDCASFLIMEEEGVTEALTHDKHFVQAGFQALLR